jgi:Carboxypeptidase regulatory-like domain
MKLFQKFISFLFAAFLLAAAAHAQGVGASGDITGTINDPSGAAIPKAKVTATDVAKGFTRTTLTDERGEYRLSGLLPSTYTTSAEAQNFQPAVQHNVVLNIGETVVLDFHLTLSQVTQSVEVTSEPPVVETERSHLANTVTEDYIKDLPIDRRDYLSFTLLMPGVSNSTRLAGDQDFRAKQTPQSGLSFYGSNGRGNTVTVDGGEANDDAGGVRLTVSQDAVQEFQINRSNYSADLGGASGAAINIVTKSGSNLTHGSLFGFFRNDALDARDPFAFSQALAANQPFNPANADSLGQPIKNTLNRQQFGGSIGLALRPDKTFLFAAFEGLRQDAQNSVPLLTNTNIFRPDNGTTTPNNQLAIINGLTARGGAQVPCLSLTSTVPAALCAGILQSVLTISSTSTNPLNPFIVSDLENNGGVFPYTTRQYLASGRLDHKFNDNNQAYLRYGYGHDREENPDLQSLTGFSHGSAIHTSDDTLQGGWFHIFNSNLQNEARAQWNYNEFNVIPNEPAQVGLNISGFANLGTNIFLPSYTILRRYELADDVTWIRGRHTMKMGVYELIRGDHSDSHTYMPGRFFFGSLPGGVVSPCLQVPAACGLLTAQPAVINSLQSLSLGLPQFYQQGFGASTYNFTRPFTAAYWQDSWRILPNFTLNYGLRYELDSQPSIMNTDEDNFAPRLSFAWDPAKNHKTVIRGGAGIFYSPIYAQIPDVVQTLGNINNARQIALLLVPLTGAPGNPALTSAAIFKTLFAQPVNPGTPNSPTFITCTTPPAGQVACISPAQLTQFGLNVSNTGPLPPAPGAVPLPVLFGAQADYQSPYSFQGEIGGERQLTNDLSVSATYVYIHTLRLPVALDVNLLPAPLTTVTLANGQSAAYRNWGSSQCQANPTVCFVNPLILQNNFYSSAAFALYQGVSFDVKQRFSHHFMAMANYTYSKAWDTTTDFNSDFAPFDETNLAAERSFSDFDQRHKFVAAGVIRSPWNSRAAKDFELAPILNYHSGNPFNLLAGVDVNGDKHPTNDRPIGAGRNTGLGPDFFSLDIRLSRTFRLHEKLNLQLLAEGFDITNRTNYASVNNVVGPNFSLTPGFNTFNVSGNATLAPTQALGFTSAYAKREFQFGFRLDF